MNGAPKLYPLSAYADHAMWWPDYDEDAAANIRYLFNHIEDANAGIEAVKERRVCVQAGGCSGAWPIVLAHHFLAVHTFEPEPVLFECMKRNIDKGAKLKPEIAGRILTYNAALDNTEGRKMFKFNPSAGASRLYRHDEDIGSRHGYSVSVRRIDSLGLARCDAIFLDVEGGEPAALQGGTDTIRTYHPVIYVEDVHKPDTLTKVWLRNFGYSCIKKVSKDSVWVHPRTPLNVR